MKKQFLIIIMSATAVLFSCEEDEVTPPLSTEENELQVAMYGNPEVLVEGFNHQTQTVEEIPLPYNRQVFVDLDVVSETEGADTLGVHYNDGDYKEFDLWADGGDVAYGSAGWDIVLAYYNGITYDAEADENVPYMMTGALINKGGVKAVRLNKAELEEAGDTFTSYDAITYDEAVSLTLSAEVDAVGNDWKALDFETFQYVIVADQYYVIETTDGVLFKLAFTSFYSDADGAKGFPKFKFERLIAE